MTFFRPLIQGVTYRRLAYLLLGLPIGVLSFTFIVTLVSLSAGLLVLGIGVVIFAVTVIAWRGFAAFERDLARGLLGVEIDPPPDVLAGKETAIEKARAVLADSFTWRSLAWHLLRLPLGIGGFVLAVVGASVSIAFVFAPLALLATEDADLQVFDGVNVYDLQGLLWVLPVIGLVLLPIVAWAISGFGAVTGSIAKALLGPSAFQQQAVLRRRTTQLEERTSLAHELHDSVGHTLTMIVVQAGAAGHVFENDPDFARSALEQIETSGRRALGELDRILGILRDDEGAERAPQPGVGRLDALVEELQATGLDIDLAVEGDPGTVPADVDLTVYRVVQESLTNVVKHAGPVPTRIRVHRTAGAIEVEVTNDAPAEPRAAVETAGGRGLEGMRERVAIIGGSVEAGPRPDGGWRVWVRLPIP